MSQRLNPSRMTCLFLMLLTLSGCFHPPYNNFRDDKRSAKYIAFGAGFGATVGAIAGAVGSSVGAGALIGGVAGTAIAYKKTLRPQIIKDLNKEAIQYVQYGDTETLIVPIDQYFYFNSPRINDLAYKGLNNIVRLLKFYPCSPIYVAGFTDSVGGKHHKRKLSQAQAEAMLTFLWANDINAHRLHPEGYGDKHPVGDNDLIRGSAYNRRLEIQWMSAATCQKPNVAFLGKTK
jgi:outer membrane protein OmpA-like peptidoglycan-associated protein